MSTLRAAVLIALTSSCHAAPDISTQVVVAASRAAPQVSWQRSRVVSADLICNGKQQYAVLGATKSGFAVAVFVTNLQSKPVVFRFEPDPRHGQSLQLSVDDLDFKNDEYWEEVSANAPGLRPSKTCKGLAVSDGEVDALHMYWNTGTRSFEWWSF